MSRFLRLFASLSCVAFLLPFSVAAGPHVHWDYEGEHGPDHWGDLAPEFADCKQGHAQTPIDLHGAHITPGLVDLQVAYAKGAGQVLNNGHTIQVNPEPGNLLKLGSASYQLAQFHFHHPSEHTLDGHRFPLEMHLVHKDAQGNLAVVGVFMQEGNAHPTVDSIWRAMPAQAEAKAPVSGGLHPLSLLPLSRSYLSYAGSLTTPPCSEGVRWLVLTEPVSVSQEQIDRFARLYPHNNRPIQALGNREIQQHP